MTQGLFKTEEQTRREQLMLRMQEALDYWRDFAEEYRVLPYKYMFLLRLKQELKINPLNKLKRSVLEHYPEVTFFKILHEEEAIAEIERWVRVGVLESRINHMEMVVRADHAFITMHEWVKDALYLIHKKERALQQAAEAREFRNQAAKRSSLCQLGIAAVL